MRTLTADDLVHYDLGANILARGSGSATPFMEAVHRGERRPPRLIAPAEVRGHMVTLIKFGATGTTRDWSGLCREALDGLLSASGLTLADIGGIAPGEINRSQMDRTMATCEALDLPLVDGDHVGASAVPTLSLCRSVPAGVPLKTSYVVVDATGSRLEVVERGLVDGGRGFAGAAALDAKFRALTGKGGVTAALFLTDDPTVLHPGSVSRTIALGAAVSRTHSVDTILRETGGRLLSSGILREVRDVPGVGYTGRTFVLDGCTIAVMNEFLTVDCAGERVATVPDHIAIVDDDGLGVLTAQAGKFVGRRLHVLKLPLVEAPTGDMTAEWQRIVGLHADWSRRGAA